MESRAEPPVGTATIATLEGLFDSFQSLIPYDRVGFAKIDYASGKVIALWQRSKHPEALKIRTGYQAPLVGSLASVAASGQPRVLNDLERYLVDHPDSTSTRLAVAEGIRSSLTCPVQVEGTTVGFVFFSSWQPNTYQEFDQAPLIGLTRMVATSIMQDLQLNLQSVLAAQAQEASHRDHLTGLLNRRGFDLALNSHGSRLEAGSRTGKQDCAVLVLDVDNMKAINDELGHHAGDQVLQEVGRCIGTSIRKNDEAGRLGGDEFGLLITDSNVARQVAQRILDKVSNLPLSVAVSIGIATGDYPTAQHPVDLVRAADEAMYRAKAGGGNRAEFAGDSGSHQLPRAQTFTQPQTSAGETSPS